MPVCDAYARSAVRKVVSVDMIMSLAVFYTHLDIRMA